MDVPTTWDEVFQHSRFKELVEARNLAVEARNLAMAQLEQDRQNREKEERAQQAQWQKRMQEYEAELTKVRRERVGLAVGLPPVMAELLQGGTDAELLAHAQQMLPYVVVQTPGRPTVPVPAPARQPVSPQFSDVQLNDPKFVRENMAALMSAMQEQP